MSFTEAKKIKSSFNPKRNYGLAIEMSGITKENGKYLFTGNINVDGYFGKRGEEIKVEMEEKDFNMFFDLKQGNKKFMAKVVEKEQAEKKPSRYNKSTILFSRVFPQEDGTLCLAKRGNILNCYDRDELINEGTPLSPINVFIANPNLSMTEYDGNGKVVRRAIIETIAPDKDEIEITQIQGGKRERLSQPLKDFHKDLTQKIAENEAILASRLKGQKGLRPVVNMSVMAYSPYKGEKVSIDDIQDFMEEKLNELPDNGSKMLAFFGGNPQKDYHIVLRNQDADAKTESAKNIVNSIAKMREDGLTEVQYVPAKSMLINDTTTRKYANAFADYIRGQYDKSFKPNVNIFYDLNGLANKKRYNNSYLSVIGNVDSGFPPKVMHIKPGDSFNFDNMPTPNIIMPKPEVAAKVETKVEPQVTAPVEPQDPATLEISPDIAEPVNDTPSPL